MLKKKSAYITKSARIGVSPLKRKNSSVLECNEDSQMFENPGSKRRVSNFKGSKHLTVMNFN